MDQNNASKQKVGHCDKTTLQIFFIFTFLNIYVSLICHAKIQVSGRVVRRCWVIFSVLGRPTIWINVGQGPIALAVGADGGCLNSFTLIYPFFPLSPSLWETVRYRLKYCLKGPLNRKQPTNQPTNQNSVENIQWFWRRSWFCWFFFCFYF